MARLLAGAFSVASSAAPDHSPPRARPWAKRSSTSISGASTTKEPVAAGRKPIRNVAMPMVSREATRVPLRPILSP